MDTINETHSVETADMPSSGDLIPSEEAKAEEHASVKVAIVTEDWLKAAFGQQLELASLRESYSALSERICVIEKHLSG